MGRIVLSLNINLDESFRDGMPTVSCFFRNRGCRGVRRQRVYPGIVTCVGEVAVPGVSVAEMVRSKLKMWCGDCKRGPEKTKTGSDLRSVTLKDLLLLV